MTTKKLCGYNNKTRRCNATSKMHPELCELGEKNYCRKKRLVLKKADLSKFMIGESQGKSLHGIKLSVLKSALQKYIRRSETEKAIQCLLEVNTFFQKFRKLNFLKIQKIEFRNFLQELSKFLAISIKFAI